MRDSTKILCKLIFLLESFHADKGEFTIEKKKLKIPLESLQLLLVFLISVFTTISDTAAMQC